MNKNIRLLFTITLVVVLLFVGVFVLLQINASNSAGNSNFDSQSIKLISGKSSCYLNSLPNYPNNNQKITKVYLSNSTCYCYPEGSSISGAEFIVPDNMFLYVVNGTIRNDYAAEEILRLSEEGNNKCIIGLDVFLYDNQGNFINTINRGNPFRGSCELTLQAKSEMIFNTFFIGAVEEVAYFEIYVSYLNPLSLF
ncbi:MAG: hypothetical protein GX638_12615 [Crenarchaeota archaeon]|nr:hypothetical protein [Thermoproteota archaeon]